MKRSGWSLVLAGLLGALFFWATDPRYGWIGQLLAPEAVVDAANQSYVGTLIGLAGSGIVLLIGLWLLTRRST
jgi:hypothetical protein